MVSNHCITLIYSANAYYVLFVFCLTKIVDNKKKENKENSNEEVKKRKDVCLLCLMQCTCVHYYSHACMHTLTRARTHTHTHTHTHTQMDDRFNESFC